MSTNAQRVLLAAVIVAAVCAACLTRIADLDFWWHLQTGRVITLMKAVPHTDIFSFTAAGHEYVDHEWLFQVLQFATYNIYGAAGVAILKTLVIATTLLLIAFYLVRRGVTAFVAGGLVLLSIAGGISRLVERPEMFSILFTALTFIAAESYRREGDRRWLFALPLLYVLWANMHAALIVGLAVQLAFVGAGIVQRDKSWKALAIAFIACVVASGVNPFGYRVLTVAGELTRIINSGLYDNVEWRRPALHVVPMYYVALAIAVLLLIRGRGRNLAHTLIGLFFIAISLRYVRNVGVFSVMLPLFVVDSAASLRRWWREGVALVGAAAAVFSLTIAFPFERGFGDSSWFPKRLVSFVQQQNLRGHMLNAYGFGGYLIWHLWPERRVFIDGRNEVYVDVARKVGLARRDSRSWDGLLREYRIEYAIPQYQDGLERVTSFDRSGRATTLYVPISMTRFPRDRWALVEWDDNGMVFVRRGGVNSALAAREYAHVYPEGYRFQEQLVRTGQLDRRAVIAELQRKVAEDPSCRRARQLLAELR